MRKSYFVKTPWWLKKIYPRRLWDIPGKEKIIYLSFDDGPHPRATPFVLDLLKKYGARASFFCIGENVAAYPDIYERICREGHRVGNHTNSHLNGYRTSNDVYLADIRAASARIDSRLFRPPYGRLTGSQAGQLSAYRIVMWDVLSGDFDQKLSKEKCLRGVIDKTRSGSIVVFHETEKAWEKMSFVLPHVLEYFNKMGFRFSVIPEPLETSRF